MRYLKPSTFGQPLFRSHPHLLQPKDLTPGIPTDEYEQRRRNLMHALPENSVVVSVAAPTKYMSQNIFYKYRQASDFWYLTGFEEPDSAVILEKASSSRGYRMTLFSRGRDPVKEQWDGARTDHHEAVSIFRADDAVSISHFSSHLRSALSSHSHIYLDAPSRRRPSTPKSILKYLATPSPKTDHDAILQDINNDKRSSPLSPFLARLRAIKSSREVAVMRNAADVSSRAHAKTMRFTHPGLSESALAAHFEYLCAVQGAQRLAYVPVVASGPNALIIHYTANNQVVREDELVLLDAGCELNGYASDITRTYPASGTFTPPQRELYATVLSAQKQLIDLCTEAAGLSLYELHRRSCEFLKRELGQVAGFGRDKAGELVERVLYPHFVGHPIGIDLHESSHFDRAASLKAGMVITVEPGIYVPPTSEFPKEFHNIGIRIEDEVLVGEKHPEVLSVSAPKEIVDVEGACQGVLGLEPF